VPWGDVARALHALADVAVQPSSIGVDEARAIVSGSEPAPPSIVRAFKHLASSDVRQALKRDAWFAQAERTAKTAIRRLPSLERALRRRFAEGPRVPASGTGSTLSARLLKQQLRGVAYSQERAHRLLGFTPEITFEASMARFAGWYETHYGWRDEWWPLLRHLRTEG
jgi:nucleoside-diphosphate-sugar epimerase